VPWSSWAWPWPAPLIFPALWDAKGDAPRLVDPDRALADLSVELWTYDFERLRDRDFWKRGW